jgi:hypothetical protein
MLITFMLNDVLPLESEGGQTPFDVITKLTFDDEEGLNQFFTQGADEGVCRSYQARWI